MFACPKLQANSLSIEAIEAQRQQQLDMVLWERNVTAVRLLLSLFLGLSDSRTNEDMSRGVHGT